MSNTINCKSKFKRAFLFFKNNNAFGNFEYFDV